MSEGKYYWLKLKQDFFDDDAIAWLEEQKNGKEYVLFYLKLCLKSLKSDGFLMRNVGNIIVPYNIENLAEITNTKVDTAMVALKLLEEMGLIQILEDKTIYMSQIYKMVGSGADNPNAERVRQHRLRKRELLKPVPQIIKHKYGEYQNVLLSNAELEKLKAEFPDTWEMWINRVSEYCASKGRAYKNYLATIRNWARRENVENGDKKEDYTGTKLI